MENIIYYIWLSLICGPASSVPPELFSKYETIKDIYNADSAELDVIDSIPKGMRKALADKSLDAANRVLDYCLKHNVGLLSIHNKQYPARLKRIENPPVLLYYRGSLPDFDNTVCIAIVGTRKMTENGKKTAYTIAYDLTLGGIMVVSGMALGIDGAAAAGALDAGGHTIAVLGCGIDVVYPPQHETLMNKIIIGGTVITEYPPHTEPSGWNFPIRNRIISGLCQGTLVVEADYRSGALITARHALVQGRDIFAVPGNIHEPQSSGPNILIRDGAHMVMCAEDIITEYESLYPFSVDVTRMKQLRRERAAMYAPAEQSALKVAAQAKPEGFYSSNIKVKNETSKPKKHKAEESQQTKNNETNSNIYKEKAAALPPREQKVYAAFPNSSAVTADKIAQTGIPVSDVLIALTMLEIDGLIEAIPGGMYKKKL